MVRTLVTPENQNVTIKIPENYIGKPVEIIAFTLEENEIGSEKKEPSFNALKLNTVGYRFNREEANER